MAEEKITSIPTKKQDRERDIISQVEDKLPPQIQKLRVLQCLFASNDTGFRNGAHLEDIEWGIFQILDEVAGACHSVYKQAMEE